MKNITFHPNRLLLTLISCATLDYVFFLIATLLFQTDYLSANVLSVCAASVIQYLVTVTFVLNDEGTTHEQEWLLFAASSMLVLGLSQLIMWLCIEEFRLAPLIVKLFATIIALLYYFATRKLLLEQPQSIH